MRPRTSMALLVLVAAAFAAWLGIGPRHAAAGVVISEFMADNATTLQDEDGAYSDWVELHNPTDAAVSLAGWYLTDAADNLDNWQFPAVTVPARGFLLVFASGKDRRVAGQQLHTDFKLAADGEYLALVRPDAVTIEHQCGPVYPAQSEDYSYGLEWQGADTLLVAAGAACRATVPTSTAFGTNWLAATGFNDSAWRAGTTGVGYDRGTTYDAAIGVDLEDLAYNKNRTAYARIPFDVAAPGAIGSLTLRMQFDDGFLAYLNGRLLAATNAPATPAWNSAATAQHDQSLSVWSTWTVSPPAGTLRAGANVLAIQALNVALTSSDLLVRPELWGSVASPAPSGAWLHFATPTPGTHNAAGYTGTSATPVFSRQGGTATEAFTLTLSSPNPAAVIRYTLDRSEPGAGSTVYSGGIALSATTMVRARAWEPGKLPSAIAGQTYVFLSSAVRTFSSDLPIVVVETLGQGNIPDAEPKQTATVAIFEPVAGRSSLTNGLTLAIRAGVRRRGETSLRATNQKPNLAIEARQEDDDDRDISPLGLPEDSDWILHAPWNFDRALLRNSYANELGTEVGPYSVRTRFVEVFLNAYGGALAQDDYAGVYVLMERVKRGADRVPIEKLEPEDSAEPAIKGGYIVKIDKPDPGKTVWVAGGQDSMYYVYPAEEDITAAQGAWIRGYIDAFGSALNGAQFRDPAAGYRAYLDVAPSLDHHIVNLLTKNVDALRLSTFIYKAREGKLTYGPIWDFDRSMECADDDRDDAYNTWNAPNGTDFFRYGWWNRLFQDPDFWQAWIDRWQALRDDALAATNLHALADRLAAEVTEAQARNFVRWPTVAPRNGSWAWEVTHMQEWLANRAAWIDSQLVARPALSHAGGVVPRGFGVTLSVPVGSTVYYTLDGSDPRAAGGTPSAAARPYTAGAVIAVNSNLVLRARAWNGRGFALAPNDAPWSGPRAATFVTDVPRLAVSEIHYNPAAPSAAEAARGWTPSDFEFIEIRNEDPAQPAQLVGTRLAEGVTFDFAAGSIRTLAPGAHAVVVNNPVAFTNRYGAGVPVAGEFEGNLDDNGEAVALDVGCGGSAIAFTYDDGRGWPLAADGAGHALVPLVADQADGALDYGGHWRAGTYRGGSPGAADPPAPRGLVINEVAAHTDYADPARPEYDSNDWIELFNAGAAGVTLDANWYLSDDAADLRKWRFPAARAVAAGGWLAVDEIADFHSPIDEGFGLDKAGEQVFLSYLPGTPADRVVDAVRFKAQLNGPTLGRYPDGADDWFALAPTRGSSNAPPAARVVITEVAYHPEPTAEHPEDNAAGEFVEIRNATAQPVPLWTEAGTWRLDGAVACRVPSGTVLAAGALAVFVPFDPATNAAALAAFRRAYGLTNGPSLLFGPWEGRLSNRGERLALEQPVASDNPLLPDDRSWSIVDEAIYFDRSPWPAAADGGGLSLLRRGGVNDGNNPASWRASLPTPGRPAAVVAIVAPRSGSALFAPIAVPVEAAVDPADVPGGVERVEFRAAARVLGLDDREPYTAPLTELTTEGQYALTAVLTGGGGVWTSAPSVVTVYGPPPNPRGYYRVRLTVVGYGRASALADFPVLVRPGPRWPGFDYAQCASPTGADLRFTDAEGLRALPYEIARWNPGGESLVWVRVPLLQGTNTSIWAHWGDPALAAAPPAYAADGSTWSAGFAAVWHFDAGIADSSPARVVLADSGTTAVDGQTGGGRACAGAGQHLAPALDAAWYGARASALTLTAWARPDASSTGTVFGAAGGTGAQNLYVAFAPRGRFKVWEFGVGDQRDGTHNTATVGAWQHLGMVLDAGTARFYASGVNSGAVKTYVPFVPAADPVVGGLAGAADPVWAFEGRLDELRLATVPRSADWVWAEYRTMADAAFVAAEVFAPGYPDRDADGMPDEWETAYFGSTNAMRGGAEEDWDGDGLPNAAEYAAGTDPTNAASRVALAIARTGDGSVSVTLPTVAPAAPWHDGLRRLYSLEGATNPATGPWNALPGFRDRDGSGAPIVSTNPAAGTHPGFYRGRVRLE